MNKFYSITEFAERIDVTPQVLRYWDKLGKFKPHHKTLGGHRCYTYEQVADYFKLTEETKED
ncbi:MerR family transcriptional regulator [Clostridium estertheticum]|uniref:helix-turn-helix domain-containing protein n=1 Tax=Clostridium estertheticum TaxID=238834 RepID=UPI0013E95369|nr:MerR family DNA-binding transcriptional regulator [Clostridium estertheticum]MBZ9688480.1 MerR family transcriptional regulator [Clostridium estertheticum]